MQHDSMGICEDRPLPLDLRPAVDWGDSIVYPRGWPRLPAEELLNEACDLKEHYVPHAIVHALW